MRMKMDVNIVRPAEIVVHTAYKRANNTPFFIFNIHPGSGGQSPVPLFIPLAWQKNKYGGGTSKRRQQGCRTGTSGGSNTGNVRENTRYG